MNRPVAGTHRPILAEYSPHFLDMMMAIVTAASLMSYVLSTMDAETIHRFHSGNIIYTTVFAIIYGIFRYLYLIYMKAAAGIPPQAFYRNRPLVLAILWGASVLALRHFQC